MRTKKTITRSMHFFGRPDRNGGFGGILRRQRLDEIQEEQHVSFNYEELLAHPKEKSMVKTIPDMNK